MESTRVCKLCRERVQRSLGELPDLYAACDEQLARLPGSLNGERISGSRMTGLPINEAAANSKAELLSVAASWSGLVIDEFGRPGPNRRDITRLSAFLRIHMNPLLSHPAASDFTREILSVSEAARLVARGGATQQMRLGICIHNGCDHQVIAHTGGADTPLHVTCEAGHTWSSHEWLLLAQGLQRRTGIDGPSIRDTGARSR